MSDLDYISSKGLSVLIKTYKRLKLNGKVMGGSDALDFLDTLKELIDEGKTNVVVDLGNVKFMNSSGLGILIGGLTTMRNARWQPAHLQPYGKNPKHTDDFAIRQGL